MKLKKVLCGILLGTMLFSTPVMAAETNENFVAWEDLKTYSEEIGEKYNIDPYILQALTENESRLYIKAENGDCKGITQINIKYHAKRMEALGVTDIYDPYSNLLVCADYLSDLKAENDDIYYILMRYNMKTSTANDMYEKGEISNYADSIVKRASELSLNDLRAAKTAAKEQADQEAKEQKQKYALAESERRISTGMDGTLPKGGAALWTEWK